MDRIKELSVAAFASIFGAIAPIQDILVACMIVFCMNFIAGMAAGVFVQRERFSLAKAFNCILEATVISTLIAMILVIGDKIDNHAGAMSAISVIVYALIYFYGTNILKNLSRVFPQNRLLAFLYYVASFEIVDKIPYLSQYKNKIKEPENNFKA